MLAESVRLMLRSKPVSTVGQFHIVNGRETGSYHIDVDICKADTSIIVKVSRIGSFHPASLLRSLLAMA